MDIVQPIPAKRAFVFTLKENLDISLRTGVIGHEIRIETPLHYRDDGKFFIGRSWPTRLVFGPFIQTSPQYKDLTDLGFVRRTYGTMTEAHLCPHRFNFQSGITFPITLGLPWFALCNHFGMDPNLWFNLHQTRISDEQFRAIEGALSYVNTPAQYRVA